MNLQNNLPPSVFPAKMQILSGSALKLIAVIVMLIDHIGAHILNNLPQAKQALFIIPGYNINILGLKLITAAPFPVSMYRISRDIGRIAFPIFCFLITEGFIYTHSRVKYGINLFLFALISEIPWNLVHQNVLTYEKQNVYFTLFLGYLGICAIEYLKDRPWIEVLSLLALLYVSNVLKADYGWRGYIFILLLYMLRYEKAAQAIAGSCWMYWEWKACFAFIPINMYNGTRGFIKGRAFKYCFYLFYPLHLTVLWLIRFYVLP